MESRTKTQTTFESPCAQREVTVKRAAYHGWPECYFLGNGSIEAIVVPAIGRVMQLRLAGESDGVFWENRALDGLPHAPHSDEWINFGGDKCWPAPQSSWQAQQGRDWPPPVAFDSRPLEAIAAEHGVTLTSPIDPFLGVQVTRHVELDRIQPVMRIRSEFSKVIGCPVTVGAWTITQLRDPERVFMLLARQSKFKRRYIPLTGNEAEDLRIEGNLLSLTRHPKRCTKIGGDGCSMVWVGKHITARMDAEDGPGEYPDGGCITQIYTSADPFPYVELETLGPLTTMNIGDRIARTTTYTIAPRSGADPSAEARKILGSGALL